MLLNAVALTCGLVSWKKGKWYRKIDASSGPAGYLPSLDSLAQIGSGRWIHSASVIYLCVNPIGEERPHVWPFLGRKASLVHWIPVPSSQVGLQHCSRKTRCLEQCQMQVQYHLSHLLKNFSFHNHSFPPLGVCLLIYHKRTLSPTK